MCYRFDYLFVFIYLYWLIIYEQSFACIPEVSDLLWAVMRLLLFMSVYVWYDVSCSLQGTGNLIRIKVNPINILLHHWDADTHLLICFSSSFQRHIWAEKNHLWSLFLFLSLWPLFHFSNSNRKSRNVFAIKLGPILLLYCSLLYIMQIHDFSTSPVFLVLFYWWIRVQVCGNPNKCVLPWPKCAPLRASLAVPKPSSLHTTLAAVRSHRWSQTVPHFPSFSTSTRPSPSLGPAFRRTVCLKIQIHALWGNLSKAFKKIKKRYWRQNVSIQDAILVFYLLTYTCDNKGTSVKTSTLNALLKKEISSSFFIGVQTLHFMVLINTQSCFRNIISRGK